MKNVVKVLALAALWNVAGTAFAAFPDKPITLVLGYTPGGGADGVSRIVAQELSTVLGQQVLVNNKPGAAGVLAADFVAKVAPDGYTLLLVSSANAVNTSIFTKLPYDPINDFTAVMQVTSESPYVMIMSNQSPVHSVQDMIAYAKANRGKISYASAGKGGGPHLAGALFSSMTGVEMTHIPYKGGSPAMMDVMRGEVNFYFSSLPTALSQIRGGKVRAIAVSSMARSSFLPEVPTVAESGLADFAVSAWYGIAAPAKTPPEVIKRLNEALANVLAKPEVRKRIVEHGEEGATPQTPEEFQRFIEAETKKYAKIVKIANITPD